MLDAIRLRLIHIAWVYGFGCMVLVGLLIASVSLGTVNISAADTINVLAQSIGLLETEVASDRVSLIVNHIRLPRALLAALIGAVLALCGTATQGLFRNPLADPSLIGVTSGASFGASAVIVLAGAWTSSIWGLSLVSLGAFLGGVLAVVLVYRLAHSSSGTSVATLLLVGIGLSALAGSASNVFEFYADNEMLRRISLWRMGGVDGANYERLAYVAVVLLLLAISLPRYSTALNAFLLGESEARHLGLDVVAVKRAIVILVAAGMGVSVAIAGAIGFVGLVVPHLMRMLIGPDHRHLFPISALAGACLLVLADLLARIVVAPAEFPVGVVTAFIGAPLFIALLRRRHQYGMQAS